MLVALLMMEKCFLTIVALSLRFPPLRVTGTRIQRSVRALWLEMAGSRSYILSDECRLLISARWSTLPFQGGRRRNDNGSSACHFVDQVDLEIDPGVHRLMGDGEVFPGCQKRRHVSHFRCVSLARRLARTGGGEGEGFSKRRSRAWLCLS